MLQVTKGEGVFTVNCFILTVSNFHVLTMTSVFAASNFVAVLSD